MSQLELSGISGVGQPNLSAYENGHRTPSADTLNRILVSCGYVLAAKAGDTSITCDLPSAGWFPDDDNPPRLPDDPADEPPTVTPDTPMHERVAVITAILDR